ncbi:uncharacterized protein LOC112637679 [Camponotus floridanus]|uniref:uncharacterized protein LOC112637679 n=1 Tax=Camponotus floridanus TaxID=104421 RepID=UPI000DC6B216|nr:uncharacterized protein LOC112637679 [Camponotus floridanus]
MANSQRRWSANLPVARLGSAPAKEPARAAEPTSAVDSSSGWTKIGRAGKPAAKAKRGAKTPAPGSTPKGVAKAPAPAPASKGGQPPKNGARKGGNPPAKGTGGKGTPKAQPAKPRRIRIPPNTRPYLLMRPRQGGGEKAVALREAIVGVRPNIKLAELGIASLKPKKAAGGDILFEVPGE